MLVDTKNISQLIEKRTLETLSHRSSSQTALNRFWQKNKNDIFNVKKTRYSKEILHPSIRPSIHPSYMNTLSTFSQLLTYTKSYLISCCYFYQYVRLFFSNLILMNSLFRFIFRQNWAKRRKWYGSLCCCGSFGETNSPISELFWDLYFQRIGGNLSIHFLFCYLSHSLISHSSFKTPINNNNNIHNNVAT
jgi:hypothetical protein